MYMRGRGIDLASFECCSCSNSVEFFCFSFYPNIPSEMKKKPNMLLINLSFIIYMNCGAETASTESWNCSISSMCSHFSCYFYNVIYM